jgi:hypothetical protein
MYEKFAANNNQPLPIELDPTGRQYKFVGENHQLFVRAISNEIRTNVDLHYPSWGDVPSHFKEGIYRMLEVSVL